MDWSQHSIPLMRLEARFGDRVVPAFCERPNSIWAMVADAVAGNPDGEALVCGERRMNWREVARTIRGDRGRISANSDCSAATGSRCCSATASNSC